MSSSPSSARVRVRVACVLPLTSSFKDRARTQSLGARLALEERGTGLGVDVELFDEDDGYDRGRTEAIARKLAADASVVAVVGPPSTEMTLPSAPVYHEAGLAHVATAATNPTLTRQGWRTFFRVVANDTQHCRDAAAFAVRRLGARRIVIIQDGTVWAKDVAAGFRDAVAALGLAAPTIIEARERANRTYDDVAALVAAGAPDLVFVAAHETVAVPLAPQLREAGVAAPFFAPNALKPFPYIATPGHAAAGPYYTNVIADPRVNADAAALATRYTARFGEEPTLYMTEAYDAMGLILDAVRRTGPQPTRARVRDAIAATRAYQGVSGSITFDANGDAENRRIGLYEIVGRELTFLGFTTDLLAAGTAGRS
jgi:branched-chain amino acid transport system substrate-binding protein